MASAAAAEADDLDVLDVDGDHEQDDEDLAAELAAGVSEVDLLREALVKPGAGRLGRRASTLPYLACVPNPGMERLRNKSACRARG